MRHEQIIKRGDTTVVKLVSEYFPNPIGASSIEQFALVLHPGATDWQLVCRDNTTCKSLNGLTVAQYIETGRKGLCAVVRPHESIKGILELKQKLQFSGDHRINKGNDNASN